MKAFVDLHIHSCLSPCTEPEMTPNNIVNMALLKGLDIIAITDHNSVENFRSVSLCAEGKGLLVIPGMEIETQEEVHLVCLFEKLEQALLMQEKVYCELPDILNREDIFGTQILMDEMDNEVGHLDRMLITATRISIDEVFKLVNSFGGVVIPAHIDRESYSVLSNLGGIPENLEINYLELSKACNLEEFKKKNPNLNNYNFIKSSDAHNLGSILERESFIEVEDINAVRLIKALKVKPNVV
jgi:3',5'-nucleoside bisphosphate phosphatase